jgi:hypothetical protein
MVKVPLPGVENVLVPAEPRVVEEAGQTGVVFTHLRPSQTWPAGQEESEIHLEPFHVVLPGQMQMSSSNTWPPVQVGLGLDGFGDEDAGLGVDEEGVDEGHALFMHIVGTEFI